ncbi:MAG TPA: hypothetical protein VJO32_05320 [Ktedonobacteraceae bacterium]|nr:hypothetical protein [Ktedonobacteraceae bacterium]
MNLWAESDNLELASTPAEQAQKPGTVRRNAAEQAVLPALRSWLLADYVAPYCRSLAATRIFRRCFWLDALGGTRHAQKKASESKGRDIGGKGDGRDQSRPYIFDDVVQAEQQTRNGARPGKAAKKAPSEILPSALQAVATLAGELASESKPITLQGIALDNSKTVGTRLIASASASQNTFSLPKESGVINASWREAAPALLPAIEQFAAVFLLNPLAVAKPSSFQKLSPAKQEERGRPQGSPPHSASSPAPTMNGVPFLMVDELAPLVQRTAPTEMCLVMMHRQVESVFLPALHTSAGAASFTALLRSDRWKPLLAREGEDAQRVDKAIDLWRAVLQPHFLFVQRVAFPMLLGPATVEDAPCSLIFATRRQDSLACMNDAVCGYRRRLERESRTGILNEGWFAAQQAERDAQALQQLGEDTLREGRARAPRRWPDLRQQLLLERFGQWMLREYDEVICRLLQADEVRCAWRQPDLDTPDGRVPGNEDMLQWQWKKRRY